VKQEKEKLMETRQHVRREAEKQKKQVLEAFEQMKTRGSVDVSLVLPCRKEL